MLRSFYMADQLTYEKVLELFKETDRRFNENLEKGLNKSRKEFDERMRKLDGKFGNILGSFVEGLVEPKLLQLFQNRGINVTEIYHNVEIHKKGMEEAEIDLLLINAYYSIAFEVKTTLKPVDVDDHLHRLDKLKKNPIRSIKGTTLLGAVAGMKIEGHADKYAYRQGLFVLKQKGEIVEIANDAKFQPKEWKIE